MKKKTSAKNLSKNQLKKLKGGLVLCTKTNCIKDTCGLDYSSLSHCGGGHEYTLDITDPSGGGSLPKTKK